MLTEPEPSVETREPSRPERARPQPLPLAPAVELPPDTRRLPAEEQDPRPAAAHRRARARAPREAHCARRVRVRQLVVVGVRDRGDPAGARPRRRARRVRARRRRSPIAMLVVLGFLILSYRQTIKAYPTAGGAYMVTRDNFGLLPAQVAGVALLTDYVLTVSVSVAAGTAALASAFSVFDPVDPCDLGRLRAHHRVRQPARRQGVGRGLRGSDLLLHGQHGGPAVWGRHRKLVAGTLPSVVTRARRA